MIHAIASNVDGPRLSRSSSWCSQRSNPKYLGRQVWGRRHQGHRAPCKVWVWSPVWAHPPIVSAAEFVAANRRIRLATALSAADTPVAEWTDRRAA
jgi:hypothetical protein